MILNLGFLYFFFLVLINKFIGINWTFKNWGLRKTILKIIIKLLKKRGHFIVTLLFYYLLMIVMCLPSLK